MIIDYKIINKLGVKKVDNSLLMRTEATSSLNFLIYIQNIFLNNEQHVEELKFPYIHLKVIFKEDFEVHYKKLWKEVSLRISEHPLNDLKMFNGEKDLFYQSLFIENDDNLKQFNVLYQSFEVWWNSFAGRFSIERSIDEMGKKLYIELVNAPIKKSIAPAKELNISFIYDECLLADLEAPSYFAVLSLKDLYVNHKEVVSKLQASIG